MNSGREVWVLLHNIRSAHNVGSIFRTSDAIGVNKILISGYSPRPIDRFKRPVKEIAKTALGAEISIPWEEYETAEESISMAKKNGFKIVGIEQHENSVSYKDYMCSEKTLIIMGEEVEGINSEILKECDTIIEIPMNGIKESLNVSVAFGIIMYRIFDR